MSLLFVMSFHGLQEPRLKTHSPLCTIENSTKCIKISFDSDSFSDDRRSSAQKLNESIISMIEIIRAFYNSKTLKSFQVQG